jgi:hypothetical protein
MPARRPGDRECRKPQNRAAIGKTDENEQYRGKQRREIGRDAEHAQISVFAAMVPDIDQLDLVQ